MNTAMLVHHLETSLADLARTCQENKRTEQCDELIVRILSNPSICDDQCLRYIEEINRLREELGSKNELHIEVNLQAFYEQNPIEWDRKKRLWKGLQNIAVHVPRHREPDKQNRVIDFLYRSLCSINNPESEGQIMKEIEIVTVLAAETGSFSKAAGS